jgi:hypothetical protein
MAEPPQLLSARGTGPRRGEIPFRGRPLHLEEGLGLLEEVMAGTSSAQRAVAQNLAATYSMKICNRQNLVAGIAHYRNRISSTCSGSCSRSTIAASTCPRIFARPDELVRPDRPLL